MRQAEKNHILRQAGPECMVLLKTDGSFPLTKPGQIALYGNGVRHTKKGGTGSGDVNVRQFINVEEAFEEAGFRVTTKEWLDRYDERFGEARHSFKERIKEKIRREGLMAFLDSMGAVMPEPDYEIPIQRKGDTAIYVLSRTSGEGTDRKAIKGDFLLTDTEVRDILEIGKRYDRFLLVLNTGGIVNLAPVAAQTNNILLLSQIGGQTSQALCDVVTGKSNPSGKLSATWADIEAFPSEAEFGLPDDVRYKEGIFVGYRYFDTVGKKPLFPFGFGKSYTSFEYKVEGVYKDHCRIETTVSVRNTGSHAGKEVMQLYVSPPRSEDLSQPYQVLAAFSKTGELMPGECEQVTLSVDLRELSTFYPALSARILEKGRYLLRVGTSSSDTGIAGSVVLEERVICERVSPLKRQADFKDPVYNPLQKDITDLRTEELQMTEADFEGTVMRSGTDSARCNHTVNDLDIRELASLCIGRFEDAGSKSIIGNAGSQVVGAAGETTDRLRDKGIASIVMADGPAGLRLAKSYRQDEKGIYDIDSGSLDEITGLLPDEWKDKFFPKESVQDRQGTLYEQSCSAIPIGTAIAQSFNPDLARKLGDLVAQEMKTYHVDLWLAPALNIQRNPLCGRNFEYYSEDPLLSGIMAAAVTRGVQNNAGCGVTLKHFACNNQETNRMHTNSIVSERALRDIYLKGFEIAVKNSDPSAIMTSYNLLNGEHTSSNKDLLQEILRNEWGYEGLVMTDWIVQGVVDRKCKYPSACASGAVSAGNDIVMPGSAGDYEDLMQAYQNPQALYPVSEEALRACAGRVINTIRRLKGDQ